MDPRTPNLFIVGAPKAGTTYLHHALGLADSVYMSAVKEPGFFTSDRDYRRGLRYYLDAYFAGAADHAVRGESTPWYLYSPEAVERIGQMPVEGPPRVIVLVRRPSDRAYSMYRDLVRAGRETRSFEQAVDDEIRGLKTDQTPPDVYHRYVWCGCYAQHIERWRGELGAEHVHVSSFDDLSSDPAAVWDELARFLEVEIGPPRFDEVGERERNPSGSLRWPRLDRLLRSFEGSDSAALERMKQALPPGLHRRVLQAVAVLNRSPERAARVDINAATRDRVDRACAADTRRLEVLMGRKLPSWANDASESPLRWDQ